MVLPFTLQGTRRVVRRISTSRKSSSKCSWWDSQQPSLHSLFSEVSQAKQRRVDFSSAGCLLDCGPKRQSRELLRRRPCVPTSSRSFVLEVLRRTIHSFSLLHCVGVPWEHFQCFLLSPCRGTEQRVSRCTLKSELVTLVKMHVRALDFKRNQRW